MAGAPNLLSTREKRAWASKLLASQEAVEDAVDGRTKVVQDAFRAGMSYASIETATGLGPVTVRKAIGDAGGTGEDS